MKDVVLPRISCLCVTEKRSDKLKRAIKCFLDQTYPNKELIVLYKDNDQDTISLLQNYPPSVIFAAFDGNKKLTLGEKRNISIDRSTGKYICNWDDDDWYHPERLASQFRALESTKSDACVLAYYLIFDETRKQGYLSHFRTWESTIMCSKRVIKHTRYPALDRNEDNEFVTQLIIKSRLYPLILPVMYIYVYHGKNTCSEEHFRNNIFSQSKKLSKKTSQLMNSILQGTYSAQEASAILSSPDVLKQFDYLYGYKKILKKKSTQS